ncbi:hypothetical protein B0A55_03553 [Friedmanniomyces simplex]|uniref:Fe2OG dioxygenase domain-containing protein n=1 Tax=Friedmanniomyces simplex TaxID=329884 RepID=A0A4U0Y227_9PEZI|nr:hypothetical protein B0A55_03553 [Friedmanniomyces simplex]
MGSTGGDRSPDIVSGAIPIVDFSRWHTNTSKADQFSVARDLTDACRTVGFVYITNHGLPQPLLDQAFNAAKRLFSLTHEEKMQAPHPDGPEVHRGYSFPGLEKVSQYAGGDDEVGEQLRQVSDCKESYEIGSEENSQQPNVWLPEATLPGFRAFTTEFYWECNKVALEILRALAMGIGLEDPEYLLRYHSGHNNQLRLLHYPPIPAAELESRSVARMPAHSDWSTMTMLFQDDCGGLEVADPRTPGKFIPATPVKGACVVNVGDLLMRWSNDYLISTLHRVTLPPLSDRFEGEHRMTRARYSIPYFVTADADSLVECLPACTDAQHPIKYDPVTQEAYARTRAKLQYRTSKAVAAAA